MKRELLFVILPIKFVEHFLCYIDYFNRVWMLSFLWLGPEFKIFQANFPYISSQSQAAIYMVPKCLKHQHHTQLRNCMKRHTIFSTIGIRYYHLMYSNFTHYCLSKLMHPSTYRWEQYCLSLPVAWVLKHVDIFLQLHRVWIYFGS